MNWVERRANRENALDANASIVWDQVRVALQDACESYNSRYCPGRHEVACNLENGNRLLITLTEFREGFDPQTSEVFDLRPTSRGARLFVKSGDGQHSGTA